MLGNSSSGILLLISGRMCNALLSLVSTAVLARLLTPADYGLATISAIIIALANAVFEGAFGQYLLRKNSTNYTDIRSTLTLAVVFALIFPVMPSVGWIIFAGFKEIEVLYQVVFVTFLALPFKAIFTVASAQLQLQGKFSAMAKVAISSAILSNICVGIPLAFLGYGVWALVLSSIVFGVLEAVLSAIYAKIPIKPLFRRDAIVDGMSSIPFCIANLINWAGNATPNAVIGRVSGLVDLGLFSRGWKILDLAIGGIATPVARVILPKMAKIRDDDEGLRASYVKAMEVLIPIYTILSALMFVHTPAIVLAILGDQWMGICTITQVLFLSFLPRCAIKVPESLLAAKGQGRIIMFYEVLNFIMVVVGLFFAISWGLIGVSIALTFSSFLTYLVSLYFANIASKLGVTKLVYLHIKAVVIFCGTIAVGSILLASLSEFHIFLRHVFSLVTTLAVIAAIFVVRMDLWVGEAATKSLMSRFGKRHISKTL